MAEQLTIPSTGNKKDIYAAVIPQIEALIAPEPDLIANLANIAAVLKQAFDFFWVGFYLVKDGQLVLGPFQGPLACTRIPFDKGVCGACYREKQTLIVPDVEAFPGHIACSSESKSEIVVPVLLAGEVRMVIDVDSKELNDFDEQDKEGLEQVAAVISRWLAKHGDQVRLFRCQTKIKQRLINTRNLFLLVLLCTASLGIANAQNDSLLLSKVQWEAYGDVYFAYDTNDPPGQNVVHTLTHPAYHNQFSLSIAYLKASLTQEHWRATAALATGTYMATNYASEPEWARYVLEANAGVRLTGNWWLDAGVFSSFLGFESPVSADNALYSRSFIAEATPYYEAGVRLSYADGNRWQVIASILNGWQRIVDNNRDKALSVQVQYYPQKELTLSYATFYGNEGVGATAVWWVHNPFVYYEKEKWSLLLEGLLASAESNRRKNNAWGAHLTGNYYLTDKWSVNARIEHFHDENEIFYSTGTPGGFVNTSWAVGATYSPVERVKCRIECRPFYSKDEIYLKSNTTTSNQSVLISSGISWRF